MGAQGRRAESWQSEYEEPGDAALGRQLADGPGTVADQRCLARLQLHARQAVQGLLLLLVRLAEASGEGCLSLR